jgi:undecaprenyl diphosphate synthase
MPWQTAYTEFLFPEILWPDFRDKHLLEALQAFAGRNRRFGGISE